MIYLNKNSCMEGICSIRTWIPIGKSVVITAVYLFFFSPSLQKVTAFIIIFYLITASNIINNVFKSKDFLDGYTKKKKNNNNPLYLATISSLQAEIYTLFVPHQFNM